MSDKTSQGAEASFVANENDGLEAYTFANKVKTRVSELGIGNYERPRVEKDHEGVLIGLRAGQYFDGRLPTVIRKLSLDQLSALYSLFSNWFGYLTTQTMLVAAERAEAIRKREFMLNHLKNFYRRVDANGKKIPETAVTDAAKTDTRFTTANANYEELNALFNIMDAMREVANQDMKVISREVTIQQEKIRKDLLQHGFANRGRDFDAALGGGEYGSTDDQATRREHAKDDYKDDAEDTERPARPRPPTVVRPGIRARPKG